MTDFSTETAGGGAAPLGNGAAPAAQPGAGGNGYGSQPAQPWYAAAAGFSDEDKAYIANKGWQGPENVYKSYRDLERVMGAKANAVLLPSAADPESKANFFRQHFGTPENPDGYQLPQIDPENMHLNEGAVGLLQNMAHAVHATPEQFAQVVGIYNDQIAAAKDAEIESYNGEVAQVQRRLEQEFGAEYGEQVARGELAMRKLGLSVDEVTSISQALGVEKATRMLMNMGGTLASDKVVGMDGTGTQSGFVTDKAKAMDNISRIKQGRDPDFQKVLMNRQHPEHERVSAQWREWQRVANS